MPLIQPPVLIGAALTAAAGPQQRGIIVAGHNGLVDPSFRQTVALERISPAVLGLGIEEATVLDEPAGAQDASLRALQDVVLGVVAKPAKRHAALEWLGLGRDQGFNPAPLEPAMDLRIGIAGVRSHDADFSARRCDELVDFSLNDLAFVRFPSPARPSPL